MEHVYEKVRERSLGARFSIVCVAEGAVPQDGGVVVREHDVKRTDPVRLGGIGELVAGKISADTGLETRVTVLGHLQRGGSPTAFDRILASKFGFTALDTASRGEFGTMVSLRGTEVVTVRLEDAVRNRRLVHPDSQIVNAARGTGISFGDH